MKPHLVHVFPVFATGGPEVRTADIINCSADRFRHSVVSLAADTCGTQRLAFPEQVNCRVPTRRSLLSLRGLLLSLQPQLVLTYGWGGTDAILAARWAGARVVHTEDGFLPDEVPRQKLARLWARRLMMRGAAQLVVPSLSLARIARREWWLPAKRIHHIANGVDVDRFAPAPDARREAVRHELGVPAASCVVGAVGALRPEKNYARLLRVFAAAAEGSSAHLVLVGDGPERQALEQDVRQLGLQGRVSQFGYVADPAKHYQAMDIFAVSSDTEQMPLALLEAMASGCASAGTTVGDVKTMVAKSNQPFLVAPADERAFAAVLSRLIHDAPLCRELGHANRVKCCQRFSKQRMFESYLRLYGETLDS